MRLMLFICLVLSPLILLGMELFHPAHFTANPGMTAYLCHPQPHDPHYDALSYFGPNWWFLLHMVQTPLVVLVGIGLLILTDTFHRDPAYKPKGEIFSWIARAAIFVFVVYFTVLDSIGGIALGRQLIVIDQLFAAGEISTYDAHVIQRFLDVMWVDSWIGGIGSFVSLAGSWAVFIAATSLAIYLTINKRMHLLGAALLIGFGWELQVAHASYHGPIAFGLLVIASIIYLYQNRLSKQVA
ncbi:hypothetical protein IEN92_01045 [Polynucleobacter sp. MWH-Creno-3A4]|uniref:hypothetical protein n=1 Tax=Polynucleobacter sp. MWH-Creno-3A4 TaxID=1855886 RepID=UPI001C0D3697|nr:hypothetical protein [Polynucleobacter sp. MWH-Creno-3A4]MBU3605336.1 hypothetical protein [Polynucleobacter sp. MWH-Creno-3A4]